MRAAGRPASLATDFASGQPSVSCPLAIATGSVACAISATGGRLTKLPAKSSATL